MNPCRVQEEVAIGRPGPEVDGDWHRRGDRVGMLAHEQTNDLGLSALVDVAVPSSARGSLRKSGETHGERE